MLERALALAAVVSILLGGALLLKGGDEAPKAAPAPPAPDASPPAGPPADAPPPEPEREPEREPDRPDRGPPAPRKRGGLPILGPVLG